MPLFEYSCQSCDHEFEALVRNGQAPTCPSCGARSSRSASRCLRRAARRRVVGVGSADERRLRSLRRPPRPRLLLDELEDSCAKAPSTTGADALPQLIEEPRDDDQRLASAATGSFGTSASTTRCPSGWKARLTPNCPKGGVWSVLGTQGRGFSGLNTRPCTVSGATMICPVAFTVGAKVRSSS